MNKIDTISVVIEVDSEHGLITNKLWEFKFSLFLNLNPLQTVGDTVIVKLPYNMFVDEIR